MAVEVAVAAAAANSIMKTRTYLTENRKHMNTSKCRNELKAQDSCKD